MTYRTDPEVLAKAWVCEATSMTGDNAHRLLVQYVDLYKHLLFPGRKKQD